MPPASAAARQVLRAYFAELASRYYGRPASHGPYSDHWFVKDGPFGT